LKNHEMQREIDRALDEVGATREKVAQVLHNGLEAKTTRVFCQDGKLIYSEPLEDHPTQVRAAEVVGKMRGDFPTNREQDRITGLVFQQNILVVPEVAPTPEGRLAIAIVPAMLISIPAFLLRTFQFSSQFISGLA
jgi:hypothetical protein